MLKFLLGILAAYAVPMVFALGIFLSLPKLYVWHDAYASIPAFVTRFQHVLAMREGDFEAATAALERQSAFANFLGMNDSMRRDLVENTRYFLDRIRYRDHYRVMLPWLEQLAVISEHSLLAQLYLAEAKAAIDPTNAPALMRPVRDLAPVLDRAYRPVIEAALRSGDDKVLAEWCALYTSAQSGAFAVWDFGYATYEGQGIGHLFLEARNEDNHLIVMTHQGFKLGVSRYYVFEQHSLPAQPEFRLHLPNLPGIAVTVEGITIINDNEIQVLTLDDLHIVSRHGYFVDRDTVVIGSYRGDILTFLPRTRAFLPSDRVVFQLEFRRLAVTNYEVCM